MARHYLSALAAFTLWTSTGPVFLPPAQAQNNATRANVPAELQTLIQKIDAAANARDLNAVLGFYSADFASTDGLNRQVVEKVIQRLWEQYPTLRYQTTVNRWKKTSAGWELELTTQMTGEGSFQEQPLKLEASLSSRQRIVNGQITWQDITSEQSKLLAGEAPPTVQFNLPTAVKVGQDYNLDVIVQEPLGDALLLGSALVQPINAETYLQQPSIKLELLPAGGLFKIGQAPNQAGSQWISVALIRDSGKVLMTQRLRVGQP